MKTKILPTFIISLLADFIKNCMTTDQFNTMTFNNASLHNVPYSLPCIFKLDSLGIGNGNNTCISNARGHSCKLHQQFSNCTSRSNFLERVVAPWNSLPGNRVNFSSLHKSKSSLKSIDFVPLVH